MALFLGNTLVTPIMVGDNYTWMGRNTTKINSNIYTLNTTLNNTDYATWTASTTATAIIPSEAVSTTISADLAAYDYLIEWIYDIDVAHTTTKKAMPVRSCGYIYQIVNQSVYGLTSTNITAIDGPNYNVNDNLISTWLLEYMTSASGKSIRRNITYGFYSVATAPTLSATSSDMITITLNTPVVNARCSSTYFATGTYGDINQTGTTIKIRANVYKVDKLTSPIGTTVNNLILLYNTPL